MALIPMKTLTLPNGKTYEITDAVAREANTNQQQTLDSQGIRLDICERSIVENTEAIRSQREDIRRSCSTAIVQTVSGSPIIVEDSSDNRLLGLQLFGSTTQIATTGAQMFNKETAVPGVLLADGSLQSSGEYFTSDYIPVTPNTVYWFSDKRADQTKFYNADKEPITDIFDVRMTKGYFATTDDVHFIRVTLRNDCINLFMLNVGSFGLPYEPYTGMIPAPSPDYPQELVTVGADTGNVNVRAESTNLLNAHEFELYSNKSLNVSDDGYTITVTGGAENPYTSSVLSLTHLLSSLQNRLIEIRFDSVSSTLLDTGAIIQVAKKVPDRIIYEDITKTKSSTVYAAGNIEEVTVSIFTNNTSEVLAENNTVVLEGLCAVTSECDWTEYNETAMSVPILEGLPSISVDDYTYCDEIDFERGVYIQRVKKVTFDGSETWSKSIDGDDNYLYHTQISPDVMVGYGQCYCDRLIRKTTSDIQVAGQTADAVGISPSPKYNVIYINVGPYMAENSVEALTTFLNENPITVIYGLKTPIETPLSDGQIAAYEQLRSVYPASVFLNDSNVLMRVSYNADTKTYLDRLPKVSDEQVQAAVNNWLNTHLVSAEGVSF